MNRNNTGNVTTNAMQILSVAGTTASGYIDKAKRARLGDASSVLNNYAEQNGISKVDAAKEIGRFEADKLSQSMKEQKDSSNRYNSGGSSPFQHLTEKEAKDYQQKRAEDIKKYTYGNDEETDVDKIMGDTGLKLDSPQAEELERKRQRDLDWYNTWVKGKTKMSTKFKSELKKYLEGGDTNANS